MTAVIIFKIKDESSKIISIWNGKRDYDTQEISKVLSNTLKSGKVTHSTNSNPDQQGIVFLTLTVEY